MIPVAALADPEIHPRRDAGAEAAERGWWGVARREWHRDAARGGDEAGGTETGLRAAAAAARLARLDTVERAFAARAADRDATVARRVVAEWSVAWRTTAAARPPAASIAIAAGLVLWNSGRAVHGVSLEDGRPPWHGAVDARDSTIFPRGLAAGRAAATSAATVAAAPPCVVGRRAYAVVALGDGGERLVCVDLSPAVEGRLVWSVAAAEVTAAVARAERRDGRAPLAGPAAGSVADTAARTMTRTTAGAVVAGAVSFDGQPVADEDVCLAVLRTLPDRGGLFLAAFAAADGRLAWVRPAGRARAATGDDLARGRRRPCLAEDRIVIVTHAGDVLAFTRDGSPAWTTTTPVAAAAPATRAAADPAVGPPVADALFAADRIVAAPRDTAGVVALDPWTGAVAWHWSRSGETVDDVIGAADDGVLVATVDAAGRSRLRRLAIRDGREQADRGGGPLDDRRTGGLGRAALVGSTVFWPDRVPADLQPPPAPQTAADSAREEAVIEVLDARTLERRRDPLRVAAGDDGTVALAGSADGAAGSDAIAVVCAVGARLACLRPGPPTAVRP